MGSFWWKIFNEFCFPSCLCLFMLVFSSLILVCVIYWGNYPFLLEFPSWWNVPILKLCLYDSLDFFIAWYLIPNFILDFINLYILYLLIRVCLSCLIKGSKDQLHVSLIFLIVIFLFYSFQPPTWKFLDVFSFFSLLPHFFLL